MSRAVKKSIAGLIVIAAVGGVLYGAAQWFGSRNVGVFAGDVPGVAQNRDSSALVEQASVATSTPPTESAGSNLLRYQNAQFHFSLVFPKSLQVTEYKEQGGALTVTFENPDADQEFQIYVAPYSGTQITAERFRQDEPSGMRQEPTDVMIGGVRATMFFSSNSIMGDTREVWFVRGGYLYEVTTFKELDAWLGQIMSTWRFSSASG